MLSREAILAADDRPIKTLPVPEWGGEVGYRAMNLGDKREWEELISGDIKGETLITSMLVKTLCDEQGNPLFTLEDMTALYAKNGEVCSRIYETLATINGIGKAGADRTAKN